MTKHFWLYTIVFLIGAPAWSYIPPYAMILSRTAENHGRGAVVVEADVTLHDGPNIETVHETWTVLDENRMRVTFQGVGPLKDTVGGTFIYENRNRLGNESGSVRTRRLGENWMEPLFYFRSVKAMRARLVQLGIAPQDSLRDRPPMKSDGPPEYEPESYVQLTRQKGMVVWGISKSFESDNQPELWIEQDQFVVTKVRPTSQVSVEADDYAKFDGGLFFPRIRIYRWGDRSVTAQLRSVRTLTNPKAKDVTSTASLKPLQFSGSEVFKDFYLRFR